MVSYNPSIELLNDYVSGALQLSHALCVATHLEYCESCRVQVDRLESVGASVFNQQALVTERGVSYDALKASVLDTINTHTDQPLPDAGSGSCVEANTTCGSALGEKTINIGSAGDYKVPGCLNQFVPNGYGSLKWVTLGIGVKLATLCRDSDGSQLALSRVQPGGKIPHHSHTGEEITVVLEGSFSDQDGIYGAGDFVCRSKHEKHTPVVTNDRECICLMVLNGPIQFTGLLSRLLNPLLRRSHALG